MKQADYASKVIYYCQKRSENLIKGGSVRRYNYYFDKMVKYAKKAISENKQDELLKCLEDEDISIRCDVAGLIFHFYPELCRKKLEEIADMTCATGLPKHFVRVSLSASSDLKYGIPKDFP